MTIKCDGYRNGHCYNGWDYLIILWRGNLAIKCDGYRNGPCYNGWDYLIILWRGNLTIKVTIAATATATMVGIT